MENNEKNTEAKATVHNRKSKKPEQPAVPDKDISSRYLAKNIKIEAKIRAENIAKLSRQKAFDRAIQPIPKKVD